MADTGSGRRALDNTHQDFADLSALEEDLLHAVSGRVILEQKLKGFFRSAIDEVIDTARTRRFFFRDLEKTEKTYLGTKFENLLRDWLQVPRGIRLDLLIGGREVDVKSTTSQSGDGWMIPPEAVDQFCILLRVNEIDAKCAVGLVRARRDYLRAGNNRDQKTSLSAAGRVNVWWVVSNFNYTPNFWELVSIEDRAAILKPKGGTERLVALFTLCEGVCISRVQIAAIASQDDYMKRLRKNGGARDKLAPKGIAIPYSERKQDRTAIEMLGLKVGYREFVSFRAKTDNEREILKATGHLP